MKIEMTLEERIKASLPKSTRSDRKIARFMLDNGLYVAFASATQVGARNGVSAATVVRFCQSLGYKGYPEVQASVRAGLPTYLRKVEQLEKQIATLDPSQTTERVFHLDEQNLKRTLAMLNGKRFSSAISTICKASDILVVGRGISAAPSLYLGHSLRMMGFEARSVLNGGVPLAIELVTLKPTSLVIGIAVFRYVAETVQAMERAMEIGAKRIAITDSIVSPLAQRANFSFQVATDGAAHALSLTSMMALINAFIAALSQQRPTQTARALKQVDAAYRRANLLFE